MSNRTVDNSPQLFARTVGTLYLIGIVLGMIGELAIKGSIIVPRDAAATAANLRSMEFLWRVGIASELIQGIMTTIVVLILYLLTRRVHRDLALIAGAFGLIATAVQTSYAVQLVQALFPQGTATYLMAFTPEQLNVLATLSIRSHVFGFGIVLLMFGPFFLITGHLIRTSGYFPRLLGLLYMLPGISYMVNGFMLILAPQFADVVFSIIAGPAFIGELSLSLWLFIRGVDKERWDSCSVSTLSEGAMSRGLGG